MRDPDKTGTSSQIRGRSPYLLWLVWIIWLPFLTPALVELFQSHPLLPGFVISLAGAVLFVIIYLWATLRNAQRLVAASAPVVRTPTEVWLPIVVLTALSLALVAHNGATWEPLFIFTAACAAGRLPIVHAVLALIALILLIIAGSWLSHLSWLAIAPGIGYVAVVGAVVISLVRSVATDRELRAAREEIARLAVTTERLRIARDLHDLLGHNLSLITLKSELAGRLLSISPERTAIEIGDIENVARTTLQEVREAVTDYRQPTLSNELHAAREILAAAGIAYRYKGEESSLDTLPTPIEAVLSWTVREGVTNVIRHSRAHLCTIQVMRERQKIGVEVIDDGQGPTSLPEEVASSGNASPERNGLRGLKERVAMLGGHYETGSGAESGFRLAVSVPLPHE